MPGLLAMGDRELGGTYHYDRRNHSQCCDFILLHAFEHLYEVEFFHDVDRNSSYRKLVCVLIIVLVATQGAELLTQTR